MGEVRVAHLGIDRHTKSPVVILQEQGGPRVLPTCSSRYEIIAA